MISEEYTPTSFTYASDFFVLLLKIIECVKESGVSGKNSPFMVEFSIRFCGESIDFYKISKH